MINLNKELINQIINAINWEEITDPNYTFSEECLSFDILDHLSDDIECRTGVSKCVFIPKNENFVIKIPFLYYYSEDDEPIELQNAPFSYGYDYCYAEYKYSSLARDANIGILFPETIQYCTYPYHIYIQEKCISEWNTMYTGSSAAPKVQLDFIKSLYTLTNFSYAWLSACYNKYGKDALINLDAFFCRYGISDFHADNYGYRIADQSPVLIDFSGFNY